MNIKLEHRANSSASPVPSSTPTTTGNNQTANAMVIPPRKTVDPKPLPPKKERTRIRKRVNTAEKRASHNAVERQRRETLNSKFLVS
jgi:hypothetical protein